MNKFKTTDGTVVRLPQPHLSHSQISMYLKCPMQYYFRYIEGIKTPPGIALVEGSSTHGALEMNNLHKMAEGEDLPTTAVVERFNDELSDRAKELDREGWGDVNEPTVRKRAKGYLGAYMDEYAPAITPESAEAEFTIPIGGVPVLMFTDVVTEYTVWDYKTVTNRSPLFHAGAAEKSLQLTFYARATGKGRAGYIGLLKDKQAIRTTECNVNPNRQIEADVLVEGVAKAISSGAFPLCDATFWACSARFCGYWNRCRGAMYAGTWPKPVEVLKGAPAPVVPEPGTVKSPEEAKASAAKITIKAPRKSPPKSPRKAPPKRKDLL